jgi:hypothetical protein
MCIAVSVSSCVPAQSSQCCKSCLELSLSLSLSLMLSRPSSFRTAHARACNLKSGVGSCTLQHAVYPGTVPVTPASLYSYIGEEARKHRSEHPVHAVCMYVYVCVCVCVCAFISPCSLPTPIGYITHSNTRTYVTGLLAKLICRILKVAVLDPIFRDK